MAYFYLKWEISRDTGDDGHIIMYHNKRSFMQLWTKYNSLSYGITISAQCEQQLASSLKFAVPIEFSVHLALNVDTILEEYVDILGVPAVKAQMPHLEDQQGKDLKTLKSI